MTRRAFKTAEQLRASEAARWEMARLKLGWHERMPEVKHPSRLCAEPRPRVATPVESTTGSTADAAVEACTDGNVQDDNRPRKRAVVRIPRKQKVGLEIFL